MRTTLLLALLLCTISIIGCTAPKTKTKCISGNEYEICNLNFAYTGKSCTK